MFAQRGIDIAPLDDTMLQSYVLDAGRSDHDVALARDALSRSHDDRLQRAHRHRKIARHLRQCVEINKADRICRRGRRRDAAAVACDEAAAHRRPHDQRLRDAGAADGAGARAHGAARHFHRPASAGAALRRIRQGIRTARTGDPENRRSADQSRQSRSNSATCCSARSGFPAAPRPRPAPGPPPRPSSKTWPNKATNCRRRFSTGGRCPSCARPIPTRCRITSIRKRSACTQATRWRRPPPGGSHRPSRICRTSRSATSRAAKSAAPSSPRRARSSSPPIIRRSNCGCSRKSRMCRRCGRRSRTAPTFMR